MPHYQRNIKFILFLILPILGFLLGWSLSQKNIENQQYFKDSEITKEDNKLNKEKTSIKKIFGNKPSLLKKAEPKNVDLSEFWLVWNTLENNYLDPEKFDTKSQIDGAIKGLVDSLGDDYTTFMTSEDHEKFEESMSGKFEGIGAEIDKKDKQIIIVSPLKNSPAESAGLKTDDIIFKVNGETTFNWSIEKAITKIRGPKGEKVDLTVLREGERKPLEISIVRDDILLPTVELKMVGAEKDIAHISIYQFGNNVTQDFSNIIQEVLLKSPTGIIIDLRGNGGGLLTACVKLISEFIEAKPVVQTSGRKFGDSGELLSHRDGSFLNTPLIVLVDKGSASASEIFAGAVQDYRRGVIIGKTTFGKGTVQNLMPIGENGAALKVTIAQWLTPNGKSINKEGITPDIIIDTEKDVPTKDYDPFLEKAIEVMNSDTMKEILNTPSEKLSDKKGSKIVDIEVKEEDSNLEKTEKNSEK